MRRAAALLVFLILILFFAFSALATLVHRAVFTLNQKEYTADGQAREMDVAPLVREGRTYLPARFVAGAFGYEVGWDVDSWAVLVGPKGDLPKPPRAQDLVRVVPAVVMSVSDGDTVHVKVRRQRRKGAVHLRQLPGDSSSGVGDRGTALRKRSGCLHQGEAFREDRLVGV